MLGYLVNFTVYTLAMIGVIVLGLIVARKSMSVGFHTAKNKFLSVESSLNLEPRKSIYVIKAGKERFLVSTDMEGTNILTKLEDGNIPTEEYEQVKQLSETTLPIFNVFKNKLASSSPYKLRFIEKFKYVTCHKS